MANSNPSYAGRRARSVVADTQSVANKENQRPVGNRRASLSTNASLTAAKLKATKKQEREVSRLIQQFVARYNAAPAPTPRSPGMR